MHMQKMIERFVDACRQAAGRGLVQGSGGNLSLRLDDERLLISSSGGWLADLGAEDVSVCRISDGHLLRGKKPSMEIGFHAGIMRTRPEVGAVLHFQSLHATALACCPENTFDFNVVPEVPYHIGPVAVLEYMEPGTSMLAEAVVAAMRDYNLALLRNHGQVTVGRDFRETFLRAIYFEFACAVLLKAADPVQTLPVNEAAKLHHRSKQDKAEGV